MFLMIMGIVRDSTRIGMNEWFAPQISEHCPVYKPTRFLISIVWFIRPGLASTFTPMAGSAHEWITSIEDTRVRTGVPIGIIRVSLAFSNRRDWEVSKNASKSCSVLSAYS